MGRLVARSHHPCVSHSKSVTADSLAFYVTFGTAQIPLSIVRKTYEYLLCTIMAMPFNIELGPVVAVLLAEGRPATSNMHQRPVLEPR